MSISTIRRQVKNVAYNFSDAQVKVREATSNDPWGPSTALMSEIADLTNNPMAFTEIMSIIWKRLNDSGKNWRHVYKSLVLLDFLIKCGNEKVAQQCRENIFTIETLKDFQHIEENRDQGLNIREKAKQITTLLSDEERLTNERTRFMLTRNKFKQTNPSSSAAFGTSSRSRQDSNLDSELEEARPSSIGEEEMQLQIALALSREECEKADEMRKSDEVRLQLALEESRAEAEKMATKPQGTVSSGQLTQSALDDLLSLGVGELIINDTQQQTPATSSNAWESSTPVNDPWALPQATAAPSMYPTASLGNDPWAPTATPTPMSAPLTGAPPVHTEQMADPFAAWEQALEPTPALNTAPAISAAAVAAANGNRKTPENFLGENSNLVNLDNLLGSSVPTNNASVNPFMLGSTSAPVNPFTAAQRKSPTLNEMRAAQQAPPLPSSGPRVGGGLPQPLQPTQANPFASPF